MTNDKTLSRIVADVPQQLKHQIQLKAVQQQRTLKDVLVELLTDWLNDSSTPPPRQDK